MLVRTTIDIVSHRRALVRTTAVALLFILVLGGIVGIYIFLSTTSQGRACDAELSSQTGYPLSLCPNPLKVALSSSNSSEFYVPVLLMKPGTTATMNILYHIVGRASPTQLPPRVNSSDVPYALSVVTGKVATSKVAFSDGTLIFKNGSWVAYRYTLNATANSSGYYAILPPSYYGMYPVLVIGANPNALNTTSLSMWGFSGIIVSGEFILPSTIVGITNLELANVTVPQIPYCPNTACTVIAHSGY